MRIRIAGGAWRDWGWGAHSSTSMITNFSRVVKQMGLVALLGGWAVASASAQTIVAYKITGTAPTGSTGAVATTGWVLGGSSGSSLLTTTGVTTGISYTVTGISAAWRSETSPVNATQQLLANWYEVDGGTITLTFTNIPYAQYDIYIYGGRWDSDRGSTAWGVNDGTTYFSGTANSHNSGGFIPSTLTELTFGQSGSAPGSYGVFSESGSTITISITGPQTALSGFEIVAVPEPATWAVIAAGVVGAGAMLRRRKKS